MRAVYRVLSLAVLQMMFVSGTAAHCWRVVQCLQLTCYGVCRVFAYIAKGQPGISCILTYIS